MGPGGRGARVSAWRAGLRIRAVLPGLALHRLARHRGHSLRAARSGGERAAGLSRLGAGVLFCPQSDIQGFRVAERRGQEAATRPGELGIPEAPTHPCRRPPHAPRRPPSALSSSALDLFPPFGPAFLLFILEAVLLLWLLFFAFLPPLLRFLFCLLPLPSPLSLTCLSASHPSLALPGSFPSSFPSLLLLLCLVLSLLYLGPPPPSPLTSHLPPAPVFLP